MRWNEVTAIFGGRFDPPHLGHREAVRGLFSYPGIRQVVVIPSATPPHKPALASVEHRVETGKINFKSSASDPFPDEVLFDLREIERARHQPNRPSYSYDTLLELRPNFPNLAFVIGTDQLAQLHTWHRFEELISLCHWIVLERKPEGKLAALQTLKDWQASNLIRSVSSSTWQIKSSPFRLQLIPTEASAVSSTQIREMINKTGIPPENSLLPEVWAYLKQVKLYGI